MSIKMPQSNLKPDQEIHGFRIESVTEISDIRSIAIIARHVKSGARFLHLHSQDSENLFSIGFPTPPLDDTGLPHILEHSVLGGSKKFPVKDPFMEMVKMSMATFINAFTYGDRTVYPVSSNVETDYFNLAEVYFDAVFHPLLSEFTFMQEGHYLTFEKTDDSSSDLIVKGIVYNEMKGAYSSAERIVYEYVDKLLLPDSSYALNSGGDPEAIPDLSYESFKEYHARYYHPSNSRILCYGDQPTEKLFEFLDKRLADFSADEFEVKIDGQKSWTEPRTEVRGYAVSPADEMEEKTFHILSWMTGDGVDPKSGIIWRVLSHILLGNEAAPLKKALIDSQLGQDLTASGYDSGSLIGVFMVGLTGSEIERAQEFETLVIKTLEEIATERISSEMITAGFQRASYELLEISSNYPISILGKVYASWNYNEDPTRFLSLCSTLEGIKDSCAEDPDFFNKVIRESLLNNPHHLLLTVHPDRTIRPAIEKAFLGKMIALKENMTEEERERVVKQALQLEARQKKSNTDEELTSLPQLKVSDLPRQPRNIQVEIENHSAGIEMIRPSIFSNGVNYLNTAFDISGLPRELVLLLPLYRECFRKMGTSSCTFEEMAGRLAASTGGTELWFHFDRHIRDRDVSMQNVRITSKFLDGKQDQALDAIGELIMDLNPDDKPRLRDVVTQFLSRKKNNIVGEGMQFAGKFAARNTNDDAVLRELTDGLSQIRFLETIDQNFDKNYDGLVENLLMIRNYLCAQSLHTVSFTGADKGYASVLDRLDLWKGSSLGNVEFAPNVLSDRDLLPDVKKIPALCASMDIAYCSHVIPAPHLSDPTGATLKVGQVILSMEYMTERVRLQGGAYGGGCVYNGAEMQWKFYSYRDPWIGRTFDVIDEVQEFVKNTIWTKSQIDRAIVGAAKHGEKPIRPENGTGLALWRHYMGDTNELRAERHQKILSGTPETTKSALQELLAAGSENGSSCVVTSVKKIEDDDSGKKREFDIIRIFN
ncbi:MAG: insulinase family protein [Candidatus Lindowbacteria bacterium]|nr:insulinase family protein [Candidatus Lindowbacteria bacterium]